ncbi:MAG: hypothetical protein WCP22_13180 [Chlamydiota bacterium]
MKLDGSKNMRVTGSLFMMAGGLIATIVWMNIGHILSIEWVKTASACLVIGGILGGGLPAMLLCFGLIALSPRDEE